MPEKLEIKAAQYISCLFHPLLIATYAFVLLLSENVYFSMIIPMKARLMIIALVFILTFLLPLLSWLFLTKTGLIRKEAPAAREKEHMLFAITSVLYLSAYYLLQKLDVSPVFYAIMIGAVVLVVIVIGIRFFWKICTHMMGVGGLTGIMVGLSMQMLIDKPLIIMGLIVLSGVMGFSRLRLQAHSPAQVFTGWLVGFSVCSTLFLIQ